LNFEFETLNSKPTRIILLGAGRVGGAIAKDLAREANFRVTAVDARRETLDRLAAETPIATAQADLQQPGCVAEVVAAADLVICAVPGFMGFRVLKEVIEAGKNVVDISFFAEDPFALDALARERGVTAVVDCGVAPGLSNLLAGHADARLERLERFACYVGGLPKVRRWPFEYKAVFSPLDVLEEYTRPARFVEHGQVVTRPALSDVEMLDFPGIGTLEAFNTDGLRTLLRTLNAPFMREKTLRYPGHAALMRVFRESGFFRTDPIEVGGQSVRPLDVTAKLLFAQWQLQPGEEDLTVMRVIAEGEAGGRRLRLTWDLLDRYDPETQTSAMARTTGYTCAIIARQVASGLFDRPGICPPEYVGRVPACFDNLLSEYERRNICLQERVVEL